MQHRIQLLIILCFFVISGACTDHGPESAPDPQGKIIEWNVNPEIIDSDVNNGAFTISLETSFNRAYNYSRFSFYITDQETISDADFQGDAYTGRGILVDNWQTDYPFNTLIKTFHYLNSTHEILLPDDTRVPLAGLSGPLYAVGVSTIVMHNGLVDISYESVEIHFGYGALQAQDWQRETINQTAFFNSTVAVDIEKRPHIAYYRLNELRYAVKNNGIWVDTSVADITVNSDSNAVIDVGPDGTIRLCYSEQLPGGTFRIRLASKYTDESAWGFTTVVEKTDYIANCSMLINGQWIYILFFSGNKLYLATNQDGGWEVSDIAVGVDSDGSFVRDTSGTMHISYQSDQSLKLLSGTINDWGESIVIDSGIDTGYNSSVAADSEDNLYISYYNRTDGVLKYATNRSGNWRIKTLDKTTGYADFLWSEPDTQLSITSEDTVNIIYYNMAGGDLMLAEPSDEEDLLYYIDREADSGAWLSAFIDGSDNLHVVYYTLTEDGPRQLRYTTDRPVQSDDQ